jgi:hypothetical protein
MTGTFIDGDDLKGSFQSLKFCNTKKGCRQSFESQTTKRTLPFFGSLFVRVGEAGVTKRGLKRQTPLSCKGRNRE